MKPLTEMQKFVVHTLAKFGNATMEEIATRAEIATTTVKEAMRRLRAEGFIVRKDSKSGRATRPNAVYGWTGKSYGEPPSMPHVERALAIKITAAAIDAMCRVGRPLRVTKGAIEAMARVRRA
ncbi:MarR family transcriptional regulator [Burkholderia cenocepacia]